MLRITIAGLVLAATASAQAPLLPGSTKDQLSGDLRGLLLKNLPNPLYEAARNWGHQSEARRLQFRGKLRNLHLDVMQEPKNDGVWRKIKVEAIHPADTLVFDLRHLVKADDGRLAFQLFVALDVHFDIRQQRWLSGIKLFDTEIRGRTRVRITLDCEATSRIDAAHLLPDLVVQLKVVRADLGYENLKIEHIAGLGGEAAEIIGELGQTLIKQWKPSIERDLLAKANAAILKAGEHKEVRVSLSKLLKSAK
jgi:hypothetical protein